MLKMSETTEIFVDIMSEQTGIAAAKEIIEFDEAFTLHHRTVFRTARSVVQDCGLAEDVTQETFIRLYNHMDSIYDAEMLRPWLIRVAINVAKNTLRGKYKGEHDETKITSKNQLKTAFFRSKVSTNNRPK